MSALEIRENAVVVNGNTIDIDSRILDARTSASLVLVLIDPDSYLKDPDYRRKRRGGLPAVRNLLAFSLSGTKLWDAEMPEEADYYHKIVNNKRNDRFQALHEVAPQGVNDRFLGPCRGSRTWVSPRSA